MADNHDLLKCPFCEGRGKARRWQLVERLTDRDLTSALLASLGEFDLPPGERVEPTAAAASKVTVGDFETEVQSWNPQLPIVAAESKGVTHRSFVALQCPSRVPVFGCRVADRRPYRLRRLPK